MPNYLFHNYMDSHPFMPKHRIRYLLCLIHPDPCCEHPDDSACYGGSDYRKMVAIVYLLSFFMLNSTNASD